MRIVPRGTLTRATAPYHRTWDCSTWNTQITGSKRSIKVRLSSHYGVENSFICLKHHKVCVKIYDFAPLLLVWLLNSNNNSAGIESDSGTQPCGSCGSALLSVHIWPDGYENQSFYTGSRSTCWLRGSFHPSIWPFNGINTSTRRTHYCARSRASVGRQSSQLRRPASHFCLT